MTITQNANIREVLLQITNDPDYKNVSRVALVSLHQFSLIGLAVTGFALSTYGYLAGYLPLLVTCMINVVAIYVSFTPLHDSSHRALSRSPLLNDALGTLVGQLFLPGLNMPVFRAIHMDHHRYVGDEARDPDFQLVELPKWIGLPYLSFVDFHWVYWYYTNAYTRWPKSLRRYVALLLVSFIGIHIVGFASPYWKEFLVLYVIPQRLGLFVTAYAFAHIQHPEGFSWEDNPFQSTVRIIGSRLKRWALIGQADHAMHHFLPHVPWFKYGRIWDLANGELRKHNIPDRGVFTKIKNISPSRMEGNEFFEAKIMSVQDVAEGVKSYIFEAAGDAILPPFSAGAHISICLPSGKVRQYSLLNAPNVHGQYQIAVRRDDQGRGGSLEVHSFLSVGVSIQISKPHNNFVLYENAERYILIAGGIGITPLLSMAHRLTVLGKPFEFHICVQAKSMLAFHDQLEGSVEAGNPWALIGPPRVYVNTKAGQSSIDLAAVLKAPRPDTMVYVCGPSGFMGWVSGAARDLGWGSSQIQMESFSAPIHEAIENHAFTLELRKSGKTIEVGADTTVIDAILHAGLNPAYACMQGTCGTCVTKVLEGEVDHRDAYFSAEEKSGNGHICLCVSRAKGDSLVIDL